MQNDLTYYIYYAKIIYDDNVVICYHFNTLNYSDPGTAKE